MLLRSSLLALCIATAGCAATPSTSPSAPASALRQDGERARAAIARELDDFHDAAAHADEARYFGHFAANGVFLGTDATERWDVSSFRAYAHSHFAAGKGWTYTPKRRAIDIDPSGTTAWFDEDLTNEKLGPTRGSGVLVLDRGRWLIAQYNLTFVIPNEQAEKVVALLTPRPAAPTDDFRARSRREYDKATSLAASGDLDGARAALSAMVAEAKERTTSDAEFWLHNQLTWIAWARGDRDAAMREVDAARDALEHLVLRGEAIESLRLHQLWDRAYLALDIATTAPAKDRAKLLAEADRAREAYDALARDRNDAQGAAVLEAFFAAKKGDGRAAAAAAKKVDAAKDDDLQDLYVIAMAFDRAGQKDEAAKIRALVCGGHDYLMKPLILRALAAEGHACEKR